MNLAILGMGTVGCGVVEVLSMNKSKITGLIGEDVTISHVFVNNIHKERDVDLKDAKLTDDIGDLYGADDIDAVIEVMGGMEDTRDILKKFLEKGIHVISANKDMLAKYIDELTEVANAHDARLLYEASVAGGIPILHAIEHGLNANEIHKVMGILNGTTNYILSKMTNDGWDYEKALKESQEKGYAEADPTNDVGGFDAQRKIVLLSRLAYDRKVDIEEVPVTGISDVELKDIETAKKEGLILKLVGKSEFDASGLSVEVAPVFLPADHQLSSVGYEKNAVYVNGNAVGETMFYGPGAGGTETASAVVSDLINCWRNAGRKQFNLTPQQTASVKPSQSSNKYFIRFNAAAEDVEAHLAGLHVEYSVLDSGSETTVVTSPIDPDKLEKLKQNREYGIEAIYQVEGD